MRKIVISQSMYFPWVGMLEQIRLADVFVHYDDVQFSRGSFTNRVQVKTEHGSAWLTVPLYDHHWGQLIDEIRPDDRRDWRGQHRAMLSRAYANAPHRDEMLALVDKVFEQPARTLADLARASGLALADYFGLANGREFVDSHDLGVAGASSQRVHDIVKALEGDIYITGHGARNYLDHEMFERSGIAVRYMQYLCAPYSQLHGQFNPYVTALDLVANCGRAGAQVIRSQSVDWRTFIGAPGGSIAEQ